MMKREKLLLLAAGLLSLAMTPGESFRSEIFHNDRVAAYLLEIPAQTTEVRRNQTDELSVFLSGGSVTSLREGATGPIQIPPQTGEVRFKSASTSYETRNDDPTQTYRAVVVGFTDRQGYPISEQLPARHYCNEGTLKACVTEKHLLCTTKICVADVEMTAGATRGGFASDTDTMLVAVSDYRLSDDPLVAAPKHVRPSGQVEWIPAGAPNRWTNVSTAPTRFIVIRFSPKR